MYVFVWVMLLFICCFYTFLGRGECMQRHTCSYSLSHGVIYKLKKEKERKKKKENNGEKKKNNDFWFLVSLQHCLAVSEPLLCGAEYLTIPVLLSTSMGAQQLPIGKLRHKPHARHRFHIGGPAGLGTPGAAPKPFSVLLCSWGVVVPTLPHRNTSGL